MTTREKKPVTFTCECCGNVFTELHGPGPVPRYAAAHKAEAQAFLNRKRVKAHRVRKKTGEIP